MSWTENNDWFKEAKDNSVDWSILLRFVGLYTDVRLLLASALILSLGAALIAALIPLSFRLIQSGIQHRHTRALALALVIFLVTLAGQTCCTWALRVLKGKVTSSLNSQLTITYFRHLLDSDVEEFLAFKATSNIFQRVIDALNVTTAVTDAIVQSFNGIVSTLVFLSILTVVLPQSALIVLLGCFTLYLVSATHSRHLRDIRKRLLAVNYPLVSKMIETIDAVLVIKALSASLWINDGIKSLVSSKRQLEYSETAMDARAQSVNALIGQTTLAFAVLVAAIQVIHAKLAVSGMLSVYVIVSLALVPVVEFANLFQSLPSLSLNVRNFFQVVDLQQETQKSERPSSVGSSSLHHVLTAVRSQSLVPSTPMPLPVLERHEPPLINLKDVGFSYRDGSPVLDKLSIAIRRGEHISLVGRSGAGKTTLFRLLLGFLSPHSGTAVVNGVDLRTLVDKMRYRRLFAVVSQDDMLFDDSLRQNLTFGLTDEDCSYENIRTALEKVDLWDRVSRMPSGIDTRYNVDSMSGGERQRFYIARALLRRPQIVLLDEPTSALDFASEGLVINALKVLTAGCTCVTIAHRLSTIREADRVAVLREGRITAFGSHEALYGADEYYTALCQFNTFVM